MASIAAVACGLASWEARCLREKSARNRRASGTFSDVMALRKAATVLSLVDVESATGDIFVEYWIPLYQCLRLANFTDTVSMGYEKQKGQP